MSTTHLIRNPLCKPPFGNDRTGRIDAARQTLRAATAVTDCIFSLTEAGSFDAFGARLMLETAGMAIQYAEHLLADDGP